MAAFKLLWKYKLVGLHILTWCFMLAVQGLPIGRTSSDGTIIKKVKKIDSELDGLNYLLHLGYLGFPDKEDRAPYNDYIITDAIKNFQRMANIPKSGVLDEQTLEMMNRPRCGMPDNDVTPPSGPRTKRYAAVDWRWHHTNLTYAITQFTPDLPVEDVRLQMAWALQYWSEVTPLVFYEKPYGPVDIEITFRYGDHGDGSPFDYNGGQLAHAFYPPVNGMSYELAGDAHFDDSEQWTILSDEGTNLLYTAIHEFGHSLGLRHSDYPDAIMWPWAREYQPHFSLSYDDIYAIQSLYGGPHREKETAPNTIPQTSTEPTMSFTSKTTPKSTPTSTNPSTSTMMTSSHKTTTPSSTRPPTASSTARSRWETTVSFSSTIPAPCNGYLDAVTQALDGHTYLFRGSQVFRVNDVAIEPGFPKNANHIFPSCPDHMTAALTYQPGPHADKDEMRGTYLFKGDQCWRYILDESGSLVLHPDFPQSIQAVWKIQTSAIDAAFQWGRKGALYFMSGDQYWRHTGSRGPYKGYPRSQTSHDILGWLPRIHAAFTFKRNTYFFGESEYYKWTPMGRRGYFTGPRDTAYSWFNCEKTVNR